VEKILLNATEVATMVGVKVPTVRKWCLSSDIPRLNLGRLVRFKLADVLAWIDQGGPSCTQRPTSQPTVTQQEEAN